MLKTATGNRIVSPRINCRNRLLHISQKLIIRRKCDPGALQRHRGEVIQACDRNFLCLCLIVRPDEERHSIKILQFILCQPRQTFSVQPFVKIRVQTRLVIPEKDDLHRIIHALEIADEIFQRLIALMKQRQILIRIGITCSECPDLLIKIRVFFRVTAMVLHGNTHDKQVFICLFALIPLYNALVKLLVGNIFPQQFGLVKIIYKMCLIESHSRVNRIAAPSRFIVRMHCHTGITDIFQIRDNGCRCITDILLIHDRTTRQKCHGISGHKLPFRVWRFRTKNGGKGMSLHDIVLQGIIIRCDLLIRQKISHHGKIRIRFTHHNDDRRLFLYVLVYITFSVTAVLILQLRDHFL